MRHSAPAKHVTKVRLRLSLLVRADDANARMLYCGYSLYHDLGSAMVTGVDLQEKVVHTGPGFVEANTIIARVLKS